MSLTEQRRKIRDLLTPTDPADAQAVYYAFHHPDDKTQLFTLGSDRPTAEGYVCLARTGMDLFRPLVTLRLPLSVGPGTVNPEYAAQLLYSALPAQSAVIISAPKEYYPILSAFFEIKSQQEVQIMILDRQRFKPIVNVLVTQSKTYNDLPRFLLRSQAGADASGAREIAASAGLNWRSSHFAEIYVHTKPAYRRRGFGRSVVAALAQDTLDSGRTPLYAANIENDSSIQLAEAVGFVDSGVRDILLEAELKPRPSPA